MSLRPAQTPHCTCKTDVAPECHIWTDTECPVHGEFSEVGRMLPPGGVLMTVTICAMIGAIIGLVVWGVMTWLT